MIRNMHVKTGKVLEEWIRIVKHEQFSKHGEIVKYLKDEYGLQCLDSGHFPDSRPLFLSL